MKNVALITGASSGIGMEFARIHASKGRDLVIVARRGDALNALKKELEEDYSIIVEVIEMDLMLPQAAQQLYKRIIEKNIEIEYLVNNAGLGGYGKFHERDLQKEMDMIQLNIVALTELTHLFLPGMIRRNKGKILNTASTAGFMPGPLQTVYFATKAFVVSFSQGIAQELKGKNITVTALCPGPVQTGFEEAAGMKGSGLFEKVASAESTAKKGYAGMEKGKLIVITDRALSFAINWLIPFAPRQFVLRMVENVQKIK
jgi:short-subunit dehydrogenase